MKLVAIVAMTANRVIGRDGTLPWHLPEDLAFFKRTTEGHPVLMGRKTYQSIGRPLPRRRNIILTRDPNWQAPGVEVIHSPADLANLGLPGDATVFVIGGAEIYTLLLPQLDEILVSHIHTDFQGDTFFPEFENDFPTTATVASYPDFTVVRHQRGPATPGAAG